MQARAGVGRLLSDDESRKRGAGDGGNQRDLPAQHCDGGWSGAAGGRADLRHGISRDGAAGRRARGGARRERMSAFWGITVSSFPNFFLLLGPNTGLGHNSVVLMIEAQVRYVMSCLKMMKRQKRNVIEVRAEAQKQFVASVHERLKGTVWQSGGCKSWYQDQRTGENTALWPGSVLEYVRKTRHAARADYTLT